MPARTYRPLNVKNDWAILDPAFGIPAGARDRIQPLSESSAKQVWMDTVSAEPTQRHPMLLPERHWLRPVTQGPDWHEASETAADDVAAFVAAQFGLAPAEPVLLVYMQECIYELPLEVFLAHWRAFLAQGDEGAFVFDEGGGAYAVFGPQGRVGAGVRP